MTKGNIQAVQANCPHSHGFSFVYKTLTHAYVYVCVICTYEMNFSAEEAGKIKDDTWNDQIVSHPNDLIVKEEEWEETIEGVTKAKSLRVKVWRP